MKVPCDVSGSHLANVLCRRWGYVKVHPIGSHLILETSQPSHQRLAISDHSPLRLGTFMSILRAVGQHKAVTRDAIVAML
jgi:predicted RNA binding protein YcfA (HicA-like mRNA interferase family)